MKHRFGKLLRPHSLVSGNTAKAGSLGAADQLIISGVNFVLMIAAARALGPSSFGVFAVVYLVLTSTQPVQESLVTAPLNVFGTSKSGDDYRRYLTSVGVFQIGLALATGVLIAVGGVAATWLDPSIGWLVLTMAAAAAMWQFQEFIRRVLYVESRFSEVLLNDAVTHGTRLIMLIALLSIGGLTGGRVFLLLAVTWAAGGMIGIWQIRRGLVFRGDFASIVTVARDHWAFGRWLLVTTGISFIPWYVTTAVMTSALSTAAYGAFRAFEQLVNAANVPLQTVYNLVRPRLARDAQQGHHAMRSTMAPIMVLGGACFAVFGLTLIFAQEFLFKMIFGSEYAVFAPSMYLFAFTPLVLLQKTVLSIGLQSVKLTRPIFHAAIVGAVVQCATSFVVIPTIGLNAAGAPEVAGYCASVLLLARTWRTYSRAHALPLAGAPARSARLSGEPEHDRPLLQPVELSSAHITEKVGGRQ